MRDLFNKPRVFLSHSKKDKGFINRVSDDFKKCQIESWIDEFEIRHGKPWMEELFQNGISTCDSVLVYLTDNSILSPMVKKEIDASLIEQLEDNKISFLPYVSEAELRDKLRADIRALQVTVWSNDNYLEVLPCVVAEIWHSYLERTVEIATSEEKRKRLELELYIEKNKGDEIFTSSENKDFSYIKSALDYDEVIEFEIKNRKTNDVESIRIKVNILSLLPFIASSENQCYYPKIISDLLFKYLNQDGVFSSSDNEEQKITKLSNIDIADKLITFGLIEIKDAQTQYTNSKFFQFMSQDRKVYTTKIHRFKYWLAYNNLEEKIKYSVNDKNQ